MAYTARPSSRTAIISQSPPSWELTSTPSGETRRTEAKAKQSEAWLTTGAGGAGYLREAYHGEPYATIRFVLAAKEATSLLAEGNREKNRDFLKKNRFELSSGGEIVVGEVQKPVDSLGRIQFRPNDHSRASARKSIGIELAEREGFEPSIPFWSMHAFQACALNHSAISPYHLITTLC